MAWTRRYKACRRCRTTKRRHAGQGYCGRCYSWLRRRDRLPVVRGELKVRVRDGVEEYRCPKCEQWRARALFGQRRGRPIDTPCKPCRAKYQRDHRVANMDKVQARIRAWQEEDRVGRQQDELLRKRRKQKGGARSLDPMRVAVEVSTLRPMLESLALSLGGDVDDVHLAAVCGTSDKRIRQIMRGKGSVMFDVAEKIAIRASRLQELMDIMGEPGVEGWGPNGARFCQRCGSYRRKHRARGYCSRCYPSVHRFEQLGRDVLPIPEERWSLNTQRCLGCGTNERRHVRRGLCTTCMSRMERTAKKAGVRTTLLLDRLGYPRWGNQASFASPHADLDGARDNGSVPTPTADPSRGKTPRQAHAASGKMAAVAKSGGAKPAH